ncbi:MAG: cell division protein FtsQ/DivIB [Pseudolactococcus laudensis]|uniref:cell division protein FtsQ/DivIB n=1 Tax=Pseudolactococcus laudensis TaxID=1494461 RepID=UPI003F9A72B7
MADKDKQPELTPWQQEYAEFQKKKQEEAAKLAREEKRKKQPAKVESVIEKYEATPNQPVKEEKIPFFKRFKVLAAPEEKGEISQVLGKIWPFILVTLLIFLSSIYVISPLSKIASFTATGNVHESTEQIAEATGIKTNDHVWQVIQKSTAISTKIEQKFPRVKSAKISWVFPNNFSAKIVEYGESVYLKTGDAYQLVLSNGVILTQEPVDAQKRAALPVLDGFNAKEVKSFVAAYETLKPELKAQITTVTKVPTKVTPDFIALEMKDGHQVRVPLSQMAEKLPYYTSVASNLTEPSVVDMEAGVYAKSKDAYQKDLDDEKEKEQKAKETAAANKSAEQASDNGGESSNGTETASTDSTQGTE